MSPRPIGISNLAWPARAEPAILDHVAALGATGIEVAPTRIAPWEDLTDTRLTQFRHRCEQAGLSISSLQAIFYQKPEAALLGDAQAFAAMSEHVRRIAGIADTLGAKIAVFGAPNSRRRGPLSPVDAMQRGAERLRILGDLAAAGGLTLGMEPVPPLYGADFLNHTSDIVEIVRRTNHPQIRAHLDTACITLAGDNVTEAITAAAPLLAHYHMAEPQLGPFATPTCNHPAAGAALDAANYTGWVVVEMREVESPDDGLDAITTAIAYARAHYAGQARARWWAPS